MRADIEPRPLRVGLLASHPIQYLSPWARELARRCELRVYYAHQQAPVEQAAAGYGVAFDWDCDLFRGYTHRFLDNVAKDPDVNRFEGCNCPAVGRVIAEDDLDALLIMGWHLLVYWQALTACRARGVPVLVRGDSQLGTPRSFFKRLSKEVATRLIVAQFDGFLCVGRRNREYLEHYGAPQERIFFVPHCVDVEFFRRRSRVSRSEREATRRELGVADGEVAALFVGRLIPLKRPGDLVSAATLLRDRGRPVRPVFVGAGPLEPDVRAQAAALGTPITMAGFRNQSELPRIYAAADVLVLPSDSETWGLVVNEAISCGLLPVVSDASGCVPDLIRPAETGFLYPAGDVAGLARALAEAGDLLRRSDPKPQLEALAEVYSCETAAENTLAAVRRVAQRR